MKKNNFPMYVSIGVVLLLVGIALFVAKANKRFTPPSQVSDTALWVKPTEPLPVPQSGDLDISICDPSNGNFSVTVDNPFFPLPVGNVLVMESDSEKVQMTVLSQTETVAGVQTRVLEEREWEDGRLAEVSRNFFAQTPDKTVCYFGEEVDDYANGQIVGHGGAWRAGENGNKPGIIMPGYPQVGQAYQQEVAPGVAMDRAEHTAIEDSYTVTAGTFSDVLVVEETPRSTKRYAKGIGMIYDDGMQLTQY